MFFVFRGDSQLFFFQLSQFFFAVLLKMISAATFLKREIRRRRYIRIYIIFFYEIKKNEIHKFRFYLYDKR